MCDMDEGDNPPPPPRGWLKRQCELAQKSVNEWPDWMKRTGGIEPYELERAARKGE